ncbi:MAG: hypothetical protein SWH68_16660 [Thermodesulfobacteriota bacterium]|nr:hypothetical protein [Thermodesulfobacteriota bacterium]
MGEQRKVWKENRSFSTISGKKSNLAQVTYCKNAAAGLEAFYETIISVTRANPRVVFLKGLSGAGCLPVSKVPFQVNLVSEFIVSIVKSKIQAILEQYGFLTP